MKILFYAAALSAATSSGPLFAQDASPAARTVVSTAGLDLSSAAGARALDLRILHAASALCGTPLSADPRGRIQRKQCRAEVRASALAQRDRAIELARRGGEVLAAR